MSIFATPKAKGEQPPAPDKASQNLSKQNAAHKARRRVDQDILHNAAYSYLKWQPADVKHREACGADLAKFLRDYFPRAFSKPFCKWHDRLIQKTQDATQHGGRYCLALFRGGGKTAIFTRAMLWATLNGYRRYGVVVGATADASAGIMTDQQKELRFNERLRADYFEVCNPFAALQGEGRLKRGQRYDGEKTRLDLGAELLIFPQYVHTATWKNAGSIIETRSITGAIRGMHHQLDDGTILRPDLVFLDDVQTRESARSLISTETRIAAIESDIAGLAGDDKELTMLMAGNTIYDGDLTCQYIDRQKKPAWLGDRSQLVEKFPAAMDTLWETYRQIQDTARRTDGDKTAATRYYADHRADMDAGAIVAWPEGRTEGRLSVLQMAMDFFFEDREAFFADRQCCPVTTDTAPGIMLSSDKIAAKVNGLQPGVVPEPARWLTAFIDVNHCYLFYAVMAFQRNFTADLVEYGAWPKQRRRYYAKDDANPTIAEWFSHEEADAGLSGAAIESLVAAALDRLLAQLLSATWGKASGENLGLSRLLIDSGHLPDIVFAAIRRLNQRPEQLPLVMPSKGIGIKATTNPMSADKSKPGDAVGRHWKAPAPERGQLRLVSIDTNYWKSTLHHQLFVPRDTPGAFCLYGDSHTDHQMLAHHLTAETPKIVTWEAKHGNRTVTEWQQPKRDNEALDCVVGCFAGASMLGAELAGATEPQKRSGGKTIRLSELRRQNG